MESLFIMFIFESIGQLSLVIGSIRNDIPNAHSVWYVSSKNSLEHFANVAKTKKDSPRLLTSIFVLKLLSSTSRL